MRKPLLWTAAFLTGIAITTAGVLATGTPMYKLVVAPWIGCHAQLLVQMMVASLGLAIIIFDVVSYHRRRQALTTELNGLVTPFGPALQAAADDVARNALITAFTTNYQAVTKKHEGTTLFYMFLGVADVVLFSVGWTVIPLLALFPNAC